jgi:NAD+ synthase
MDTSGIGAPDLKLPPRIVREMLVQFIRDEVRNAGFSRGIVGLSGGVDSALVTLLAAEALGKDNVTALLLPYRTSNPASAADAARVALQAGVRTETVDITPMVEPFFHSGNGMDNVRKGNVMARQRMIVLYDRSARESALVIGTSNKSEILLGYGTQFGDTACALNPIGDLYKTQVWQLAEEAGVPADIIGKKPTADLWEGQTDETELGFSYKLADRLLYCMVDERRTDPELIELGFEKNFILKVRELVRRNQFKRRPPVIAKISHRTVNVDFRYSRDWGT